MFNDGVGCGDVITRRGFIAFSSGSRPDGRCWRRFRGLRVWTCGYLRVYTYGFSSRLSEFLLRVKDSDESIREINSMVTSPGWWLTGHDSQTWASKLLRVFSRDELLLAPPSSLSRLLCMRSSFKLLRVSFWKTQKTPWHCRSSPAPSVSQLPLRNRPKSWSSTLLVQSPWSLRSSSASSATLATVAIGTSYSLEPHFKDLDPLESHSRSRNSNATSLQASSSSSFEFQPQAYPKLFEVFLQIPLPSITKRVAFTNLHADFLVIRTQWEIFSHWKGFGQWAEHLIRTVVEEYTVQAQFHELTQFNALGYSKLSKNLG